MDLNKDLEAEYQFHEQFDVVTNNGTGEHVFDQAAVYRNAHKLTRAGGLMVHVMPFVNYVNHGFYSFHPNLYHALAVANGYDVVGLGIATRYGAGVIAIPPGAGNDEPLADFLLRWSARRDADAAIRAQGAAAQRAARLVRTARGEDARRHRQATLRPIHTSAAAARA